MKTFFINLTILILILGNCLISQPIVKIESLPPDSISATTVRLKALLSLDGSLTSVILFIATNDGFNCITWNCEIKEYIGDTILTKVIKGLLPNTKYDYYSYAIIEQQNNLYGGKIFFSTTDGPRGELLINPLFIKDKHNLTRTLHFGVQTYATDCIDPLLGEYEEPPYPPEILVVMARFQRSCYGLGTHLDLRPYISQTQVDTYRVRFFTPEEAYPVIISWNILDSLYSENIYLKSASDIVNMKTVTTYEILNPDISAFTIIAESPRPEKNTLNVITQDILEWGNSWGKLGALIYPNQDTTRFWFEWGTTIDYGNVTPIKEIVTKSPIGFVLDTIQGLSHGSLYYFRGVTEDSIGTNYGMQQYFKTSGSTDIQYEQMLPTEFLLSQNHPNPFNPTTNFEYTLPSAVHVTLRVFNMLGQEVTTLVDKFQEAGYRSVTFNASLLPSGVYYYRIWVGTYTNTKKMILVK